MLVLFAAAAQSVSAASAELSQRDDLKIKPPSVSFWSFRFADLLGARFSTLATKLAFDPKSRNHVKTLIGSFTKNSNN